MRKLFLASCFAVALTAVMFVSQDAYAGTCPKNCVSWYDGCNTCGCSNGRTTYCTRRACKKKGRAYCKKKAPSCPTCSTIRCRGGYKCVNVKGCGKCIKKPKPRPKTCPKNCVSWYDGCNTCSCKNGRIGACTKRYCKTYTRAYCKKKKPRPRPKTCPKNCVSWYDGCNTCTCKNGRIGACTKRACKTYSRPYCKKKKPRCPTCRTIRCRSGYKCINVKGCGKCIKKPKPRPRACPKNCVSWYDGCNTCTCKNGRIGACTKRACFRRGRAYCKKRR